MRPVLCTLLVSAVGPSLLQAQQPAAIAEVVAAFLPDSADRAPRVTWTTGAGLPIRWLTPAPVAAPYLRSEGMSHRREGTVALLAGGATVQGQLVTQGVPALVMQATVAWDMEQASIDSVLAGLDRAGFQMRPLKCDRATEGFSYGNAAYLLRVPGKRPQGLHLSWNCGAAVGCTAALTVLYRRADIERIECAGG